MDWKTALRAGAVQLVCVGVLAAVLGVALGHQFFRDNGWWAGPGAWLACAAATGALTRLPIAPVLVGAVLAGIPSGIATLLGLHWEGAVLAVIVFALWCGRLAVDRGLVEELV